MQGLLDSGCVKNDCVITRKFLIETGIVVRVAECVLEPSTYCARNHFGAIAQHDLLKYKADSAHDSITPPFQHAVSLKKRDLSPADASVIRRFHEKMQELQCIKKRVPVCSRSSACL